MRQAATPIPTLLEIGRNDNGEIPIALISAAYRASRSMPIMLVLHSISANEVDRLLDPVVARTGCDHRGVVYANLADDSAVLETAASADRVFAASEGFRAKLASRGIAFRDIVDAEPHLRNAQRDQ